jgi:NAD(P)-dependent dehydrogenase (short-subunit alcohol dehydrogenase family)
MAGSLQGSVALVTGASSGIGEATALALAGEGATVAIAARRLDRLEALSARISQAGRKAFVIQADVGLPEEASTAVEQTVVELGRLDTLINNAGVGTFACRSSSQARPTPSCAPTTAPRSRSRWPGASAASRS